MKRANLMAAFVRAFVNRKFIFSGSPVGQRIQTRPDKRYMLYLHIPFCESLCPYCSFFRVPMDQDLAHRYFDALRAELELYRRDGVVFERVYIGGGTPTVLPQRLVELLDYLRGAFPIKEISVETNPKDLQPDILQALKQAGVNRLSVGVQTFDDPILAASNRLKKYGTGHEVLQRLQQAAGIFDTLNADLIFNFPGQTETMLEHDIQMLLASGVDQVTWYPLMTSDVTAELLQVQYGKIDYKQEERLYRRIRHGLAGTFSQSSVWCYSRSAAMLDEYVINDPEYIGVGVGALSYINGRVYANTFSIPHYLDAAAQSRYPLAGVQPFNALDCYNYELLFKLFSGEFALQDLNRDKPLWLQGVGIKELFFFYLLGVTDGWHGRIRLTQPGYQVVLSMMREMITGLNNFRAVAIRSLS